MTAAPHETLALDRPLPGDVLRRVRTGLSAYQNYPVFSWPWLRRRTARGVVLVGVLGGMIWLGAQLGGRAMPASALGYFVTGFALISSMGPALATWVRHRRWPLRREQPLVIGALLVGVLLSAGVDGWASGGIEAAIGAERPHTQLESALDALLEIGVGAVIIVDGGLTDWTQRLLSNRRERLFTSGIGLGLLAERSSGAGRGLR